MAKVDYEDGYLYIEIEDKQNFFNLDSQKSEMKITPNEFAELVEMAKPYISCQCIKCKKRNKLDVCEGDAEFYLHYCSNYEPTESEG